jgi:predicted deacylase
VFSVGKRCLDEYVRDRGKVGITIELGEKGPDREQAERTYECALRFLAAITAISRGTADLEALAAAAEPISWYETRDVVPAASSEHRLRPGLDNWTAVEAGELLSPAGAPEIRASAAGRILFPKYTRPGDPPPPELFRLGVFVEDPARVFG